MPNVIIRPNISFSQIEIGIMQIAMTIANMKAVQLSIRMISNKASLESVVFFYV